MRIFLLRLVKDQVPLPVQGFEVGLYPGSLVGFLLLVPPDLKRYFLLFPDFGHERFEHLLKERVLQFVVLHVAIHGGFSADELQQFDIPTDEFGVQGLGEKSLDDIKPSPEFAEQRDRLEDLPFFPIALARRRVTVCDQKFNFDKGGTLP